VEVLREAEANFRSEERLIAACTQEKESLRQGRIGFRLPKPETIQKTMQDFAATTNRFIQNFV
jgi:hypothetical protein